MLTMFGIFRYALSLLVVYAHLAPLPHGLNGHWAGAYSVFCFYILSGYLMTLILNTTYANYPARYFLNRALRIYPPYVLIAVLSLVLLYILPESCKLLSPYYKIPSDIQTLVSNFLIIGLSYDDALLIPTAWSLNVELVFYLLMVFLSRSRAVSTTWFLASVLYTGYTIIFNYDFQSRYFTLAASSLPFSIGAMIYWYNGKRSVPFSFTLIVGLMFILNLVFAPVLWSNVFMAGLYVSVILGSLLIASLKQLRIKKLKNIDSLAGSLSYPVFLCHFIAPTVLIKLGFSPRSWSLFFYSYLITNSLALLINYLIERRIEVYRSRIKTMPSSNPVRLTPV